MPEYRDLPARLREATKRPDLPDSIVALLSESYAELVEMEARIQRLKEGFEGCCTACEPVAEKNNELRAKNKLLETRMSAKSLDELAKLDEELGLL
jgi:hypothetical protein